MKKRLSCFKAVFVILLLLAIVGCQKPVETDAQLKNVSFDDIALIEKAFKNKQSNLWVKSSGEVVGILPDDLEGSRHQRFIVRLNNDQTLLISHNIDIAPRVSDFQVGDQVSFYGEYEWNDKGGAVHWTHHDPQFRRAGGWIEHKGKKYN